MTERQNNPARRAWSRRARAAVVALATVTVLAGCVAIPASGGVNQGPLVTSGNNGDSSIVDLPLGPPRNASKDEIIADFLQAATSSAGNYQIAREFLSPKAAQSWDPTKSVLIREKPANPQDVGDNSVTYTVSTKASVSALGVYSEQSSDSNETLTYSFSKVKGQWRISDLPDGVVVSRSTFDNTFGEYPVYFFDPDFHYLVPDVRWFPTGSTVPGRIVLALAAGPSDWLSNGVVTTAFPAGVTVAPPVVVHNNTADVDFSADAASTKPLIRARIQNQLLASLQAASITEVDMTAHGAPLAVSGTTSPATTAVARESAPLLAKGKQFGFYPGLQSLGALSTQVVGLNGTAIALDHAQTAAAVLAPAGVYIATGTGQPKLVDSRPGLIAPSIDSDGYVWSVPSNDGSAIVAVGSDGVLHPIASTIPTGSTIVSLDVSRDGTRALVYLITSAGPQLIVAGIKRTGGVPTSLGQLLQLPVSSAQPIDAAWVDASTVAALGSADGEDTVISYVVGGSPGEASTTEGGTHIVGGGDADSLRLITGSGQVQQLRATGWQDIGVVASVLATQQ